MSRQLVLMGSGETTPTMVETHKRVLAGRSGTAVIVDTPYGFQENAADLSTRTLAYFDRNVGRQVEVVELRDIDALGPAAVEAAVARIASAAWVFAGPGSPTYVLGQWLRTRLVDVLRSRLETHSATVFASAAACTVGRLAIPVYEIYKVGQAPRWVEGLDLLATLDLPAVVVPHFDNAEGGNHDTRFCYLGERRLRILQDALPEDLGILGIDEHTAAVIDLDAGTMRVEGRGTVTARAGEGSTVWPTGTTVTLAAVRAALQGNDDLEAAGTEVAHLDEATATEAPSTLRDQVDQLAATFRARLDRGEAIAAAQCVLDATDVFLSWAADPTQSEDLGLARQALDRMIVELASTAEAGLHDHRDLVAPHVETLLDLRDEARASRDFDRADRIREGLERGGVEVRDTREGVDWELTDPSTS